MKKILSLILALLMIVSCASFIFAEDAVTLTAAAANEEDSAYYDAVAFLVKHNIMHGKGDSLGVYDNIKRYEMALFIGRICTGWVEDAQWEDGTENNSGFTDLAGTAAENYYGAISYVANKGIIEGVGGAKFAPEAGIKYEDALTMAVRTLGYKDLAYPWGYIEKAVELGLTDGISGLAYTEELKREVVAQIIYNTLFATGADGTKLCEANFGINGSYEIAIISATDGGKFFGEDTLASAGYVKFALLGDDGKLSDARYVATAETFGFEGEHGDEENLGAAFKVILDGNGKVLSAEALELDRILNEGLNSKTAGKYPIQAFLADVSLTSSIAAAQNSGRFMVWSDDVDYVYQINELWAVDWQTGNVLKKAFNEYEVVWFWNDLLQVYFQYKFDSHGTVVGTRYETKANVLGSIDYTDTIRITASDCYGVITDKNTIKTTAYAQLRLFDLNGDGEGDYGMYDAYRFGKLSTTAPILDLSVLTAGNIGDSYASILAHRYDWFGDASDEEFWNDIAFPKFKAASEVYLNTGFDVYDYSLVPNGGDPFKTSTLVNNFTVNIEGCRPGFVSFQNGGATMNGKIVKFGVGVDDIWVMDGGELPENGSWVIYGADPATKGVKIVKTIGEYEEGSDTYIATGILRSYNTAKKTVTIDDETFNTSYDELTGSTFTNRFFVDNIWYMGTQYFSKLFNQFVTYIVVDGKVVYVEACGAEDYRFLIVSDFAGISTDGYIVVDAWDTADGKNKQIRIASCDGWKFGDFFYYAENYQNYASLFTTNTYLQILSYDAENNAYGVTAIKDVPTDDYVKANQTTTAGNLAFHSFDMEFTFAKLGIRYSIYCGKYRAEPKTWDPFTPEGGIGDGSAPTTPGSLVKNMSANDKYVLIFAPGEIAGSPIRIYEGEVTDPSWYIKGWRLDGPDGNTHIFMGLKAGNVNGFNTVDTSRTLVMIPDYYKDNDNLWYLPELGVNCGSWALMNGNGSGYYQYISAAGEFAGQQATENRFTPWGYRIGAEYTSQDLLGNTSYDVTVLDLRTLHIETVKVSNKNMKPNFIYECVDGKVVGEPHAANELYELLIGTFGNNARDLENDKTELFTDTVLLEDFDGHAGAAGEMPDNDTWGTIKETNINKWLTKGWLGTAYEEFGSYTIKASSKYSSVVTVYEASDGHAEIAVFGNTAGAGGYHPEGNRWYGERDKNTLCQWLGKNGDKNGTIATVTVINMDKVKMQNNLDPYGGGLASVTYVFDERYVTVNDKFQIEAKFDKTKTNDN